MKQVHNFVYWTNLYIVQQVNFGTAWHKPARQFTSAKKEGRIEAKVRSR